MPAEEGAECALVGANEHKQCRVEPAGGRERHALAFRARLVHSRCRSAAQAARALEYSSTVRGSWAMAVMA